MGTSVHQTPLPPIHQCGCQSIIAAAAAEWTTSALRMVCTAVPPEGRASGGTGKCMRKQCAVQSYEALGNCVSPICHSCPHNPPHTPALWPPRRRRRRCQRAIAGGGWPQSLGRRGLRGPSGAERVPPTRDSNQAPGPGAELVLPAFICPRPHKLTAFVLRGSGAGADLTYFCVNFI
jgi:hypothetical protein